MTVAALTRQDRSTWRMPVVWGLVTGAAQAASPLAFWWLDMRIRPPRKKPWTARAVFMTVISFPLLPILTVIFLALPVIEAQTRLLLGIPIRVKVAREV